MEVNRKINEALIIIEEEKAANDVYKIICSLF